MTRNVINSSRNTTMVDTACEAVSRTTVCVIDARTLSFTVVDDTPPRSPPSLYVYRATEASLRDDVLRATARTQPSTTASEHATPIGCAMCGLAAREATVQALEAEASNVSLAMLAACTRCSEVDYDEADATAEVVAACTIDINTTSSSFADERITHVWLVFACGCCAMVRFALRKTTRTSFDSNTGVAMNATQCGTAVLLQAGHWFALRLCASVTRRDDDDVSDDADETVMLLPSDVPLTVCLTRDTTQSYDHTLRVALAYGRRRILYAELRSVSNIGHTHDTNGAQHAATSNDSSPPTTWSLQAVGLVPVNLHADGSYQAQGECRALRALHWVAHSWDYAKQHPLLAILHSHAAMQGDPALDHMTLAMLHERRPRLALKEKMNKVTQGKAECVASDVQWVDAALVDGPWFVRQLTLALPNFLFYGSVRQRGRQTTGLGRRYNGRGDHCQAAEEMDSVLGVFLRPSSEPYWSSQLLREHADAAGGTMLTDACTTTCTAHSSFAFVLYSGDGEACRCDVGGYVEWAVQLPRRSHIDVEENRADVSIGAVLAMLSSGTLILLRLRMQRPALDAGTPAATRRCTVVMQHIRVSSALYGMTPAMHSNDDTSKTSTLPVYPSVRLTACLAAWLRDDDKVTDALLAGCMVVRRMCQCDATGLHMDSVLLPFSCTANAVDESSVRASENSAPVTLPYSVRAVRAADLVRHTMQPYVNYVDNAYATASQPSSPLELLACAALPRCQSREDKSTHVGLMRCGRICTWSSNADATAVRVRSRVQWPMAHTDKTQAEYDAFVCRTLVHLFSVAQSQLVLMQPLWQPAYGTACTSQPQPDAVLTLVIVVGSVCLVIAADSGIVLHATTISPVPLLPVQLTHVCLPDLGNKIGSKTCWFVLSGLQLRRVAQREEEKERKDKAREHSGDATDSPWRTALSTDASLSSSLRATSYVCVLELSWLTFDDVVAAQVQSPVERQALVDMWSQGEHDCAAQLLLRASHVLLDAEKDVTATMAADATEDGRCSLDGMPFFCIESCDQQHVNTTATQNTNGEYDVARCDVLVATYDRIVRLHCALSSSTWPSDTKLPHTIWSSSDTETWLLMRDVMMAVQPAHSNHVRQTCELQYMAALRPYGGSSTLTNTLVQSDAVILLLLVTVSYGADSESSAIRHSYLLAQPRCADGRRRAVHAYHLTAPTPRSETEEGTAAILAVEHVVDDEDGTSGNISTSTFLARTEDKLTRILRIHWAALASAVVVEGQSNASEEAVVVHRGGIAEASAWLTVT